MEESEGILDLPFEDIVTIIEKLDYDSIENLCYTSSNFNELCRNPVIRAIRDSKRPDEVGQIVRSRRDLDILMLGIPYKSITPHLSEDLMIALRLHVSQIDDIEILKDRLKGDRRFFNAPLGGGFLSTTPIDGILSWEPRRCTPSSPHSVVISLDKIIIQRLLEESVILVRNEEWGKLTIFRDRRVRKRTRPL